MSIRSFNRAQLHWFSAGYGVVVKNLQKRFETTNSDEDALHLLWRLGVNKYKAGDGAGSIGHLEELVVILRDKVDIHGHPVDRPLSVYEVTLKPKIHLTIARAAVFLFRQKCQHELLLTALHNYRATIESLVVGLDTMIELPKILSEFGVALELFGAFDSAMDVYARILVAFPTFRGYFDALYRSTFVGRHLSVLRNDAQHQQEVAEKNKDVLHFLLEALPANILDVHIVFFYARTLEASANPQDRFRAQSAFESLFELCKKKMLFNAPAIEQKEWLQRPRTWLQLGDALAADGELLLATESYNKFIEEDGRQASSDLSVSMRLKLAKHFASYQDYTTALHFAEEGLKNDRFCRELRELISIWSPERKQELRRDEEAVNTILHAWKGRCWSRGFVQRLRTQVVSSMQERLQANSFDVDARIQLAYYARDRFRPFFLFEEVCVTRIQRAFRLHRKTWIWQEAQRQHHSLQFTDLLHKYQKSPYDSALRNEVICATRHKFIPRKHLLFVVAKRVQQENTALRIIVRNLKSFQLRARIAEKIQQRGVERWAALAHYAVRIQAQVRRQLAKKKLKVLSQRKLYVVAAVIKIQKVWRMFLYSPHQMEKRGIRKALRNRGKAMFILRKRLLPLFKKYQLKKHRSVEDETSNREHCSSTTEKSITKQKIIGAAECIQRFYKCFIANIWRKISRVAMAQQRNTSLSYLLCRETSVSTISELERIESLRYHNPGLDARNAAFRRMLLQRSVLLRVCPVVCSNDNFQSLVDLHMFSRLLRHPLCRIERIVLYECNFSSQRPVQEVLRKFWTAASKCVSLRSLWIVGGYWAPEHLTDAVKLVQIDNARIVEFVLEKIRAAHSIYEVIGTSASRLLMDYFNYSLPGLQTISLHNCSLRDDQLSLLAEGVEVNSSVHSLHFSLNWVTDRGFLLVFEAIKRNPKSNIRLLNFCDNMIHLGTQMKQSLLGFRSKPHQKYLLEILLANNRILVELEPVDFAISERVSPQLLIYYSSQTWTLKKDDEEHHFPQKSFQNSVKSKK